MAYSSIYGNRPPEFASKAAHSQIINSKSINDYLAKCQLPKDSKSINQDDLNPLIFNFKPAENPIPHVFATDCGYHISVTRKGFPSSKIAFLNFGAFILPLKKLENMSAQTFVSPKEIAKLRQAKTWPLVIPMSGITYGQNNSLLDSVRMSLNEFFNKQLNPDKPDSLSDTLKWLLYQKYKNPLDKIKLTACPNPDCTTKDIPLPYESQQYKCPQCDINLFLIDSLQLQDVIDEDQGVDTSLPSYIASIIEQLLITHYIRLFINDNPAALEQILFLKDGPLAFFGFRQTSPLHRHMRNMLNHLQSQYTIYLAGLEKSGSFVEHATEICQEPQRKLVNGQFLLLNNNYIYKYIIPGKSSSKNPYGKATYYSLKIIFQDTNSKTHVITIPVTSDKIVLSPTLSDLKNLDIILTTLNKLKCDMYNNALLPITLINKSVSLANRPSATILQKFSRYKVIK